VKHITDTLDDDECEVLLMDSLRGEGYPGLDAAFLSFSRWDCTSVCEVDQGRTGVQPQREERLRSK